MEQTNQAQETNQETNTKRLTMLEFKENDTATAQKLADKLGFTQTAYTSTSDIIGLFCLRDNPQNTTPRNKGLNTKISGCVIKTKEFGFMFVATDEDCGFDYGVLQ